MKSRKTAKFIVFSSVICLILCCTLAIGSTFAWFTDAVTSGTNIIKSGTLDIEMYYKEPGATEWADASQGAIFNYQLWEPGYVDVKQVKIANVGSLALQYNLLLAVEGDMNDIKLAEVIDVYVGRNMPATREDLSTLTPVGTLRDLLGGGNYENVARGILLPLAENGASTNVTTTLEDAAMTATGEVTYTVALKMQESAGNEYQNLQIGLNGVKIVVDATQYTWENDAFDHLYDDLNKPAGGGENDSPMATVTEFEVPEQEMYIVCDLLNQSFGQGKRLKVKPTATFTFTAQDTATSVQESPYKDWLVDYYVSVADGTVEGIPAPTDPGYEEALYDHNSLILMGCYGNWDNGAWYGFKVPDSTVNNVDYRIPTGLLGFMTDGISNWTYADIVSGVQEFSCGFVNYSEANKDDLMTVELCLINPENTNERITVASITKPLGVTEAPEVTEG